MKTFFRFILTFRYFFSFRPLLINLTPADLWWEPQGTRRSWHPKPVLNVVFSQCGRIVPVTGSRFLAGWTRCLPKRCPDAGESVGTRVCFLVCNSYLETRINSARENGLGFFKMHLSLKKKQPKNAICVIFPPAHQLCLKSSLKLSGQLSGTGSCRLLLPTPQMIAEESTSL